MTRPVNGLEHAATCAAKIAGVRRKLTYKYEQKEAIRKDWLTWRFTGPEKVRVPPPSFRSTALRQKLRHRPPKGGATADFADLLATGLYYLTMPWRRGILGF